MRNKTASFILAAALALVGSSVAKAFQPVVTVPFTAGTSQSQSAKITSTEAPMVNGTGVGLDLALDSVQFDASAYTQARVVVVAGSTAFNGTTSVIVRFEPSVGSSFQDQTFGDYAKAGASSTELAVTPGITTKSIYVGPWTALDAGAIGDDVLIFGAVDTANGNTQPTFGRIEIQFR